MRSSHVRPSADPRGQRAAQRARSRRPSRRRAAGGTGARSGTRGCRCASCCQRQSGAKGSRIHTGRASAPARCAMLVSTLMTRSSAAMSAALRVEVAARIEQHQVARGGHRRRSGPRRRSFCSENHARSGDLEQRREQGKGTGAAAVVAVGATARPRRADAQARRTASQHAAQRGDALAGRREVRHVGRNVGRGDAERAGDREQRQVRVVGGQRVVRARTRR